MHAHARARQAFVDIDGVQHPAPAPRFGRTPGEIRGRAPAPGQDSLPVLMDWGFAEDEMLDLVEAGVVGTEGEGHA